MKDVFLIGAGGHSKTVVSFLKEQKDIRIVGLIDKQIIEKSVYNIPVIGADGDLENIFSSGILYSLITVGGIGDNSLREKLYKKVTIIGFHLINAIHPSCIIAQDVIYGQGNTIMAGAIINPGTIIDNNVIINTGSVIEHDCIIKDHVHIAPGAKIGGGVYIGEGTHIGIGAVVIQGINIGRNVLIGAGTVVINNIPDNAIVVGVPGKVIKYR